MIVVITPEHAVSEEKYWINAILEEGVDRLHIRKPFFSEEQMENYLRGIEERYYGQLALHSHHDLARNYGVKQLHFTAQSRQSLMPDVRETLCRYSTSTHHIDDFNQLDPHWDYAFLSPMFASISKPGYGSKDNVFGQSLRRTNTRTRLIALGGVTPANIPDLLPTGADGFALCGAVWSHENPLKIFKQCRKIALSY